MKYDEYIYDESGFIIVKDACINIDSIVGMDIHSYGNDWYVSIRSNIPGFVPCITGLNSSKKANETMSEVLKIIRQHKQPKSTTIEI